MKGTSKLPSRHLSADRPLQRLRGCFLPPCRPPTGSKFRNVQVLLTFLMCVNLQHFVTERDIRCLVQWRTPREGLRRKAAGSLLYPDPLLGTRLAAWPRLVIAIQSERERYALMDCAWAYMYS